MKAKAKDYHQVEEQILFYSNIYTCNQKQRDLYGSKMALKYKGHQVIKLQC